MQGKQLFEQGQYAQAIEMFQRSITADPRNADGYYNMATAYYYLGKQQKNATLKSHGNSIASKESCICSATATPAAGKSIEPRTRALR